MLDYFTDEVSPLTLARGARKMTTINNGLARHLSSDEPESHDEESLFLSQNSSHDCGAHLKPSPDTSQPVARSESRCNVALPDPPVLTRRQLLLAAGLAPIGLAGSALAGLIKPAMAAPHQKAGPEQTEGKPFAQSRSLASSLVKAAIEQSHTSSISMALISDKGLLWAIAQGVMGAGSATPVSTNTLYCIGSCSKLIATVAAMQLVERGLLALDEPVASYLPAFKMASPEYRQITVRMLLNHQSGFPGSDYSNAFTTLPLPSYSEQVLQTLSFSRLKHDPGEMSVYCNDGFTVIEQVIKAVTGIHYVDYVQRNILDPLGMRQSRFAVQLFPEGLFAPGTSPSGQPFQECINVYASGGLFTTPSEMASFAQVFLNQGQVNSRRILSAKSIESMAELQATRESLRPIKVDWGFGLGWDDVKQGAFASLDIKAWRKNGGTSVYGSDFYVLPDHGLAFMITGTSTNYQPDMIAEEVLLTALKEQGHVTRQPTKVADEWTDKPSPYAVSASDLVGIYANYQAIFRVSPATQPDSVQVQQWQNNQWPEKKSLWQRRADGLFKVADTPATAFGIAQQNGQRYLTLHTPSGAGYNRLDVAFAQMLTPMPELDRAWITRTQKTWIVINEHYTSLALAWSGPSLKLFYIPELPGYVGVNVAPATAENHLLLADGPNSARMALKIPYNMGRDLNDLLIRTVDGIEHLQFGRMMFRPIDSFALVTPGATLHLTVYGDDQAVGVRAEVDLELEISPVLAAFVYSADMTPSFPSLFRANLSAVVPEQASEIGGITQHPARIKISQGGLILLYGNQGSTVTVRAVA